VQRTIEGGLKFMEDMVGRTLQTFWGIDESKSHGSLSRILPFFLRRILPIGRIGEIFRRVNVLDSDACIQDRILEVMNIDYEISALDRGRIPSEGPLVVVANHPFGAVEGLILASILRAARSDVKIMANYLLGELGIRELNELFIMVDPFERPGAVRPNFRPLREAINWVQGGQALGIFPAGEVSHLHVNKLRVIDRQWSESVGRIVRKTKASVLPVYFEGRNSALFCALGMLHPVFRTLMLPGEALRVQHRCIQAHIGKPIPFNRLSRFDDASLMDYLRLRTYNLQHRKGQKTGKRPLRHYSTDVVVRKPIVGPKPSSVLGGEIRRLPEDQVLISSKDLQVVSATAAQIPEMLHEIGRLREITFRKAGEGTGQTMDIDNYDGYYTHLVLWNRSKEELVGAYRLGPIDSIIEKHGLTGMYTSTLFDYKEELFSRISPALEVGRSFVRPEYQKTFQPLMLLWSGIGRFVARHPQYRFLFGAVSINNDYLGISRRMIVQFLKKSHVRSDLAHLVKGRNPFTRRPDVKGNMAAAYSLVDDVQDLSQLISDIEKDEKGIPILLKHYMKLGGQFLGFNVDPLFNNALDALVMVDLTQTEPRMLERYMGQEGLRSFLDFHGVGARYRDPAWQTEQCA
jgi:putative hemolysin